MQHQTTELWLKLVLHELSAACDALDADDIGAGAQVHRAGQAHPEAR